MTPWQSTLFDRLRGASGDDAEELVAQATVELGFTWFEYGLWRALPLSCPGLRTLGNTPAAWRQRYAQQRHARLDPVVAHARHSREPLAWDLATFKHHPTLLQDAQRHGLNQGWTLATINPQGLRGMLTVSRPQPALHWEEAATKNSDLSWLAYMAHLFLTEQVLRQREHDSSIELTPREAEILRWMGDGKTTGDIGAILHIAHDTVNFHLRNAMMKLNANNRTSAVVTALMEGRLTI